MVDSPHGKGVTFTIRSAPVGYAAEYLTRGKFATQRMGRFPLMSICCILYHFPGCPAHHRAIQPRENKPCHSFQFIPMHTCRLLNFTIIHLIILTINRIHLAFKLILICSLNYERIMHWQHRHISIAKI